MGNAGFISPTVPLMDESRKNSLPTSVDSCLKVCETASDEALKIEKTMGAGLFVATSESDAAENWFMRQEMLRDIWPPSEGWSLRLQESFLCCNVVVGFLPGTTHEEQLNNSTRFFPKALNPKP